MFGEPFPQVTQWVNKHLDTQRKDEFYEYRYAVEYHLSQAEQASQECSSVLWHYQWILNQDQKTIIIMGLSPELLIRQGDVAIRESASAIDTGLQLVNYILHLDIEQTKIRWGREPNERPLRKKLLELPGGRGKDLVAAIDSIFRSIGYELLQGYRNWITHRGAPSAEVPLEFAAPIPVPVEALQTDEPGEREWLIQTYLMTTIPSQIHIRCWPFVPPVHSVIDATINEANADINLPGIHVEKGARGISIRNMRVIAGSLTEGAEEFKSKNPILLDQHRAKFAGEDLAVYTAMDYTHAVGSTVRFAEQAVTGKWDTELCKLCDLRP